MFSTIHQSLAECRLAIDRVHTEFSNSLTTITAVLLYSQAVRLLVRPSRVIIRLREREIDSLISVAQSAVFNSCLVLRVFCVCFRLSS